MQKILIIQTAFIGDVVLATALLEKWHGFYPEDQIDFLVRKGNEGLLDNHPFLHEVLIWNKKENKTKNLFQLLKKIRRTKYDKVINLQRFAVYRYFDRLFRAQKNELVLIKILLVFCLQKRFRITLRKPYMK